MRLSPAERTTAMRPTMRCALAVGCALALAACSSSVVRSTQDAPRPVAKAASKPRPGATTVVARGDTLYAISVRYSIAVQDLAAWNGLAPPYTIYPGQRLRLYPGGRSPAHSTTAPPRAPSTAPRQAATPPRAATPAPAPVAPPASGFAWRWPADGGLLARYVAGEPTRQGIDIGGTSGAPVRAAAAGTVVYSGAGLVGYGELVIIKHSEQWLSAYGHNRRRLVNEGQIVKAGEQIAEMGRSGAPRDMLHFEIRYNGKPVDPLRYLPAR